MHQSRETNTESTRREPLVGTDALKAWAQRSSAAALRVVAGDLAAACRLLHEITPALLELHSVPPVDHAAVPEDELHDAMNDYVCTSSQVAAVLSGLRRARIE